MAITNYSHTPRARLDLSAIVNSVGSSGLSVDRDAHEALRNLLARLQASPMYFNELEDYAEQGVAQRRAIEAAGVSGWLWIEPGVPSYVTGRAVPRWTVSLNPLVSAALRGDISEVEWKLVFGKPKPVCVRAPELMAIFCRPLVTSADPRGKE